MFDPYNMHEMICVDHELPDLLIPAPNATSSMVRVVAYLQKKIV